jgi:filamentous hemagglutinin family protein
MWKSFIPVFSLPLVCGSLVFPAHAQSITPTPDGTGTIIHHNGNTYHIDGGTQAGANLFHSFQAFGLSSGEIANFLSNPSISNIFGRVTGGDRTLINGLIQANSNLYLINPAGIVFGSGASLNVGGDFTATTADRIGFENGWFNATGANDYASLMSAPNQFAFASETPGAILNFGDLSNELGVSLIGGTVLNEGQITSTQGNVTVAAIPGDRLVNLSQPGMLLSLDVPTDAFTAEINPLDLPSLLTGSGATLPAPVSGGDVAINGKISGQQVDLYAAGQVTPTDPGLIQGDARVIRFSESGENPDQAVFIDRRADNPDQLLYGAAVGTVAQIIERDEHGIDVVSEELGVISDSVGELESVAIVAEGNAGNFWLGNQWIRSETIGNDADQLQTWRDSLTANADLLLYSCFTALGATGEALMTSLASLTGADVAASVDLTGSPRYGGDWELETSTGSITTSNPFTAETLLNWDGKLATLTVQNAGDNLTVDGSLTLREALQAANTNSLVDGQVGAGTDTILFDPGGVFATAQTITTALGEFVISEDVVINGTGQTQLAIDGGGGNRVFNISATNATIQNLTIQNGIDINENGAGIYHTGNGTLTMQNTTVSGNSAGSFGGGIRSNRNVILIDSIVMDNYAVNGGGIFGLEDVILINSIVMDNDATNGGGISGTGALTLTHSTVVDNSAASRGGGISGFGTVTLTHSTVADNLANLDGGGINSTGTVTLTHSTVAGNSAASRGGGIFNGGGEVTLTHSTVAGNSAASGGGMNGIGDVMLSNSTISGNSASNDADGIFNTSGNVTLTDHPGDLDLDIYARSGVFISGSGSITITGSIQTNGNPLTINAATTLDTTALTLDTSSGFLETPAFISNTGGGDITLTAGGNLTTRNLITAAFPSGNGGHVSLTSTGGSINTLSGGGTGAINTTAANGNSGTVTLNAPQGIVVGSINTEAINGAGGAVTLDSEGFVRVRGELAAVDSSFNSVATSISSGGSSAGGAILIRHGGNGLTPFIVGEASTNGTQAALSAGTGLMIQPTQTFLTNHIQPGISILTTPTLEVPVIPLEIIRAVSGSAPKNQNLNTEDFIRRIGRQAGGETTFDAEGKNYTWSLPGEAALGGSLNDNIILQEFLNLDESMTSRFQALLDATTDFGDVDDTTAVEDSTEEDEESSVANIRETFQRIREQTGTTPAMVYILSQVDYLELILVTPDNQLRRHVIPAATREELMRTVSQFRRGVLNQRRRTAYVQPAQQLYDWMIAPLVSTLDALDVDTLIFAMGEGLRHVPLAALYDGDRFLIEQYSLGQIPSLSLTNSDYQPLQAANLLMMGASEFQSLSPLPGVEQEARLLAQVISSSTHLNEAFTSENLAVQSRDRAFDIVHLATHADFNAGQVDDSYIQLWGDEQISPHELRRLRWYDDPQVELLVLSACETALGNVNAELGFAGLAVQAGVKSALASLWQVSDRSTMALMGEFYQNLVNPDITTKAEALRQAQLALLRRNQLSGLTQGLDAVQDLAAVQRANFSHPFYWSAFMMVGSPW